MVILKEMDEAKSEGEKTPLIDSMRIMLGSIDNKHVQACSITKVPERLRKSKVEAYMPTVVSIGPIHKGTRTELQYMEDIKWRCTLHLLHRSRKDGDGDEILSKCCEAMLGFDEVVRAVYNLHDLKFNSYDLAKIMVLDGCFLLELLISGSEERDERDSRTECRLKDPSPGTEVIKRKEVLSDLTLLENQIPLFVLKELFTRLFPEDFTMEEGEKTIHNLALSLLGNTRCSNIDSVYDLIGLVHRSFIDKEESESSPDTAGSDKVEGTQGNKDHSIPMPSDGDAEISHEKVKSNTAGSDKVEGTQGNKDHSHERVKLKWCATKLKVAGVTIKHNNIEPELFQSSVARQKGNSLVEQRKRVEKNPTPKEIRFNLNIRLNNNNRELEIPPLHITKTTEYKWRNFIAWEVNRTVKEEFISEPSVECKFIWYARFFQSLICCVHDIQLLRDKNVIVVDEAKSDNEVKKKVMSDEDLHNFFRNLTKEVPDDLTYKDFSFSEQIKKLNSRPSGWCRADGIGTIIWHLLMRWLPRFWSFWRKAFRTLKRYHIPTWWKLLAVLAVTAGLILTALQTFAINSSALRG